MNDLNQETTETAPEYQSPDISEMLAPETGVESEVATEPTETASDAPAPVVEAAPVVPPVTAPIAPQMTPEYQAMFDARLADSQKGILRALQTERAKRQELEQQLGGAIPADQAMTATANLQSQFLALSENAARRHYKDFDSVYGLFLKEAGNNDQLRDTVLNSPDPGEAAYQAGLQVKLVQELGPDALGNPYRLLERGEQRGYERAKAELQKEYEAKLSARAGEKHQTPTDISKARSAGSTSVPYRSPSLTELLKKSVR